MDYSTYAILSTSPVPQIRDHYEKILPVCSPVTTGHHSPYPIFPMPELMYTLPHEIRSLRTERQPDRSGNEKRSLEAAPTAYPDFLPPVDCHRVPYRRTCTLQQRRLPVNVPIAYLQQIQHTKASNGTITEQHNPYPEELRLMPGRVL